MANSTTTAIENLKAKFEDDDERTAVAGGIVSLICSTLRTPPDHCRVFSNGDMLYCDTEDGAEAIADLIDALYSEGVCTTGTTDAVLGAVPSDPRAKYYIDII